MFVFRPNMTSNGKVDAWLNACMHESPPVPENDGSAIQNNSITAECATKKSARVNLMVPRRTLEKMGKMFEFISNDSTIHVGNVSKTMAYQMKKTVDVIIDGTEEERTGRYKCPWCSKSFIRSHQCWDHVNTTHYQYYKFHCGSCEHASSSYQAMYKHVRFHKHEWPQVASNTWKNLRTLLTDRTTLDECMVLQRSKKGNNHPYREVRIFLIQPKLGQLCFY